MLARLAAITLVIAILLVQLASSGLVDRPNWRNPVGTAEEDRIKSLPGLDEKVANFSQYSGYLQTHVSSPFSQAKYTHYWLVEAQETSNCGARDEEAARPLIVWLNGGPGTSSLRGLFLENGPFKVTSDGKRLEERQFSWNKLAHVLYLESPVPVGFSYLLGRENIFTDRDSMSQVSLALSSFFKKFPQFKANRMYMAGEGYGAAYGLSVVAYHQGEYPNLAGFISSGGYLDGRLMNKAGVLAAYANHWINSTDDTWARLSNYCCDGDEPTWWTCEMRGRRCALLTREIYANIKSKFGRNPENIRETKKQIYANQEDTRALTKYLNQHTVSNALNIPDKFVTFNGQWQMHRELPDYMANILLEGDGLNPIMKNYPKFPILLYTGDADLTCSGQGSQWFVEHLGRRRVSGELVPWVRDNRTLGYVTEYEVSKLVIVAGAGHSVARDQPQNVFELVKSFLDKNQGGGGF